MTIDKQREAILKYGRKMLTSQLTTGAGGNLSICDRTSGRVAISPSGIEYFDMKPEDVVITDLNGQVLEGKYKPSSELGFHLALYRERQDVNAVVHTHSVYATTMACLGWEIPAVHYLVGFSGYKVPVAPYATFGTDELAQNVAKGIGAYNAVLLANHGLVAVGSDIGRAFNTAEEIELVARIYYQTKAVGEPVILPDQEMERVLAKFATYGQSPKDTDHV
ncbi:D-ribulose-1-phosphate/L-fuculose-1-phosphate aldolase [Syntrophotalea carbinolica DSM 2380]|uniref:D-ribulose-1-phosphate/L-fuculose-1-phosphate aldolase n=1 Tax=Syntrophotalea carbinolica (strain DSM 2380 / NBRC 103641 / GraBd1) TaxID=338963 RepID=Q3A042_SYNC1|nr:L-fuculose-phosphate aldolase [Syntrophotalea carbinolica]ABA90265.1 D-ribulose-1-phosphate/L-fuculose-1-phosphate aldolase [Syntrophotalea carbinolica DSM 2380]